MDTVKAFCKVTLCVCSLMLTLTLASPAIADVLYTYTGNSFDQWYPSRNALNASETSISGSITLPSPLSPNLYGYLTLTSYSFTDGQYVLNSSNSSCQMFVKTGSLARLDYWHLGIRSNPIVLSDGTTLTVVMGTATAPPYSLDESYVYLGTNTNYFPTVLSEAFAPVGTWAGPPYLGPPVFGPAPEPSTMLLLGSGLIGLVGYGRKKFLKK